MERMVQLEKFVEWHKQYTPGQTHIAEWALNRIRELEGKLKDLTESVEAADKYLDHGVTFRLRELVEEVKEDAATLKDDVAGPCLEDGCDGRIRFVNHDPVCDKCGHVYPF